MRTRAAERYQDLDEMANALVEIRQRVDPSGSLDTIAAGDPQTVLSPTSGADQWTSQAPASSSSDRVGPARPPPRDARASAGRRGFD